MAKPKRPKPPRPPLTGAALAAFMRNSKDVEMEARGPDEARLKLAALAVTPEHTAAKLVSDFTPNTGLTLRGVTDELTALGAAVGRGDLSHLERMLAAQAVALNAIFVNLAERAAGQGAYLDAMQMLLGLALRAQNQCRATVETLAEVKFPKSATFIRQANIAEQQQVNNAAPPRGRGPDSIPSSQLLEAQPHEALRLDTRTASTAGGADSPLAAVGEKYRAEKP